MCANKGGELTGISLPSTMHGVPPASVHCAVGSSVISVMRRRDEADVLNPPDANTRWTASRASDMSGGSGGGGALGGKSSSGVMVSASALHKFA